MRSFKAIISFWRKLKARKGNYLPNIWLIGTKTATEIGTSGLPLCCGLPCKDRYQWTTFLFSQSHLPQEHMKTPRKLVLFVHYEQHSYTQKGCVPNTWQSRKKIAVLRRDRIIIKYISGRVSIVGKMKQ